MLVYVVALRKLVVVVLARVLSPAVVFVRQLLQQPPLPHPRLPKRRPPNVGSHFAMPLLRRLFRLSAVLLVLAYANPNAIFGLLRQIKPFRNRHPVGVVVIRCLAVGVTRLPLVRVLVSEYRLKPRIMARLPLRLPLVAVVVQLV